MVREIALSIISEQLCTFELYKNFDMYIQSNKRDMFSRRACNTLLQEFDP